MSAKLPTVNQSTLLKASNQLQKLTVLRLKIKNPPKKVSFSLNIIRFQK
jgi:hypothetical protein